MVSLQQSRRQEGDYCASGGEMAQKMSVKVVFGQRDLELTTDLH